MQRIRGIPHTQTEPAAPGEVRWIERLQQRSVTAPAPSAAVDVKEAGLWIKRLQQRVNSRSR
jgi:hypothetical protein